MAYNEYLQERIEIILSDKKVVYESRKMLGGLCYMVDDKMCFGIIKDDLMARVGEEEYPKLIDLEGARPMDFTNRPMKGYIFVAPEGVDYDSDLKYWIERCLKFNPKAKSSKKNEL